MVDAGHPQVVEGLIINPSTKHRAGFPGGSDSKESVCNAGDLSSIPGLARSPAEGHSNLFQHSCLENSMDRGAWQSTFHGITKSQISLSD